MGLIGGILAILIGFLTIIGGAFTSGLAKWATSIGRTDIANQNTLDGTAMYVQGGLLWWLD